MDILREVMDASTHAMFLTDAHGIVTHINTQAQERFGLAGQSSRSHKAGRLSAALAAHGAVCVAGETAEGKLTAPALSFETLAQLADFVLVEADGAKRLPLKAHAPHEPVIPPNVRQTIYVVGADGFGRPIRQICHRPERYAALCGAAEDDVVTPELEAAVLRAEGYAGGWVYVNKVETPQDWRNAEALAALLPGKVVAGSLWEKRYRTIS